MKGFLNDNENSTTNRIRKDFPYWKYFFISALRIDFKFEKPVNIYQE